MTCLYCYLRSRDLAIERWHAASAAWQPWQVTLHRTNANLMSDNMIAFSGQCKRLELKDRLYVTNVEACVCNSQRETFVIGSNSWRLEHIAQDV